MDFEREMRRVAETYAAQGYEVIIRPGADQLPPFAKDFKIEILARRGAEGVLVAVKRDRDEVAADADLTRYAEITHSHRGWKFDFAIVDASKPSARDIDEAQEFTEEDIEKTFEDAIRMSELNFLRPAVITAWAGFEAAMRLRLRAAGERIGWGTSPQTMLNELYSNGLVTVDDFRKLEALFRVRNQIAHGFISSLASDGGAVRFLCDAGRRLMEDARKLAVPA